VYLGTATGVYRTTDAGQNWSMITSLGPADAFGVLADTKTPGIIYVGGAMVDIPNSHLFANKLSPDGSSVQYSSLIAGASWDGGFGIAVDGSGNAYITGFTSSGDFPSVGGVQNGLAGGSDAFVVKLDTAGRAAFLTLIGGGIDDEGRAEAVDSAGNIYLAGFTYSPDFPLVSPIQSRFPPSHGIPPPNSAIIMKIGAPGAAPHVDSAQKQGKSLWVYGSGFADGAVIIAGGNELNTVNDSQQPSSTLMSKKGGKKIKGVQPWTIQVRNPDGTMSNSISFIPSN